MYAKCQSAFRCRGRESQQDWQGVNVRVAVAEAATSAILSIRFCPRIPFLKAGENPHTCPKINAGQLSTASVWQLKSLNTSPRQDCAKIYSYATKQVIMWEITMAHCKPIEVGCWGFPQWSGRAWSNQSCQKGRYTFQHLSHRCNTMALDKEGKWISAAAMIKNDVERPGATNDPKNIPNDASQHILEMYINLNCCYKKNHQGQRSWTKNGSQLFSLRNC